MNDQKFWRHVRIRTTGCWKWTGCLWSNGYGRVRRNGRCVVAHRIAWELTNNPVPEGKLVLHKCDVRSCCRPSHLFIGTDADNVRDCIRKGRRASFIGERHPMAKLTPSAVLSIRKRRLKGEPLSSLAARYDVTPQAISLAANGKSWSHL